MGMVAYLRRLPAMARFAGSTVLTTVTLAALAGVTPALSADYQEYGRYGERPYEYPAQVYPQPVYPQPSEGYEQPREYRVVIYPVRRPEYFYEREPNGYRVPRYSPDAYPGRYEGALRYDPNGYGGRVYGRNDRYGYADRRYGDVGREFEEGALLPPAPVGPRRPPPVVYAPPYTWQ